MKTGIEAAESERLQHENLPLRSLVAARAETEPTLSARETRVVEPTRFLAMTREEMEQQLRLFDTALSSIADYVFVCDLECRIIYANQARLELWQRALPEVLGRNFLELDYPPALAARIHGQIQTVIATKAPLRAESEYTGSSGLAGYYDYILVPVLGTDGEVECVTGSTRNITERRRMEQELQASEAQSREILESITDAFVAVDRDWRFTYVNKQAERLLDRSPGDLLGQVLWEMYPGMAGSEFALAYLRAAHEGVAASLTAFYPDHDRWYEVHVYPAHHGITIYFQNVTERIRAEELAPKQCIGLSLILNELVSNALKHGRQQAEIFLTVEDQQVTLTVCDDGDGFPEEFDSQLEANTGLDLVDSLVRTDLLGTIVCRNQPQGGGQVTVTFPLPAS